MASKIIHFVLIVVVFSLVVDNAEAGWKFWKKKNKDEPTTTLAPDVAGNAEMGVANGEGAKPGASPNPTTNNNPSSTRGNVNSNNGPSAATGGRTPTTTGGTRGAIAAGANPGLAIGVGTTGENIRANANRPGQLRPNPGTDVGLDFPVPKTPPVRAGTGGTSGQGYRDWAADLTGAGHQGSGQAPRVPSSNPASSIQIPGQQPHPGSSRPASPVVGMGQQTSGSQTPTNPAGGSIGKQQQPAASRPGSNSQGEPGTVPRPGSPPSTGAVVAGAQQGAGQTPKNSQRSGLSDDSHVSTLNIGSLNPGQNGGRTASSSGDASSAAGSRPTGGSSSPTGPNGKSWAEIAGNGGNSRSGSPASPRPGSVQPARPVGHNTNPGQSPPGQTATGPSVVAATSANSAGSKVYSSNPTYSKGNTVTDEDLEKLAEALFIKDTNNANRYITVNLQKQTTGSNTADQAPQPLLTVNSQALQIPTIEKVISMYDNYKLDTRVNEYISPAQRQEESLLVDTFLSTNVMSAAMRFLADKAFLPKDYYAYKDTLRRLWFNLYSRGDGKIGSAGFEHVFLTELKLGTEVSGLHNWIYFNAEEIAKRADYLGYIKKLDLGDKASIIKFHAKFNNIDKPVTTMFIGTSPELEMALYTVCFFARPERSCPLSLGGTKFNVVTHKFKYRGKDLIGSAYPDI